jgi:FHA domain
VSSIAFRCPQGHDSTDADYCDVCGTPNPAYATVHRPQPAPAWSGSPQTCPVCGGERLGDDRYCTDCGYDFDMGQPLGTGAEPVAAAPGTPAPAAGASPALAVVTEVDVARLDEPGAPPPPPAEATDRLYIIDRSPLVIGRDNADLDIPIQGDPYVSRRHAEIVWTGTGWGVRDLGSTNSTRVNGVVLQGTEVRPLVPDDVIEVGFFSRLKVRSL